MAGAMDVGALFPSDGEGLAKSCVSDMAMGLVGSEILKIAAEIRAMQAAGQDVVNLTVGDFAPAQFPIPTLLAEGIRKALAEGHTNYPPSDGIPELRRSVVQHVARTQGLRYPVESVLIAGGARPLLYGTYRAILDPGDTVIYPVPSWNNNHYCHLSGVRSIVVESKPENAFLPAAEDLLPHLGAARLLVLNSPLNPTGTAFSRQTLADIARAVCQENERRAKIPGKKALFVLYDQVYAALAAPGTHVDPVSLVPEVAPYVVLIDGISKAFAATGLRVGWSLAAPSVTARMRDLLGHVGAWAPKPEQRATAELLDDQAATDTYLTGIRAGVDARLRALYDGFLAMKAEGLPVDAIPPAGAIYLSARVRLDSIASGASTNEQTRRWILEKAALAVVPFQAFAYPHNDGWFRLSVGAVSVEQCSRGVARLSEALRAGMAAKSQ